MKSESEKAKMIEAETLLQQTTEKLSKEVSSLSQDNESFRKKLESYGQLI